MAPKIIWSSGIVLDCPPEVNGRIVFLKRPHILIIGHREIKLEMCWELPLCCPGYWERRLIRSPLLSCEPSMPGSARKHLTRWGHSGMMALEATDLFLVGLEAHSEGRKTHLVL